MRLIALLLLHGLHFLAAIADVDRATRPHNYPEPWGPPFRGPHSILMCGAVNAAEDVSGMPRYQVVPNVGIRLKKATTALQHGVDRGSPLRVRV